ncbi:hypothetical protein BH09PSE5_BH09PSE5_08410 [soil metagenome]
MTPTPTPTPIAFALEWTTGDEKGVSLYASEQECRLAADRDGGVCTPLVRQSDALALLQASQADVERLRADAIRYQWLKTESVDFGADDGSPWCVFGTCVEDCYPIHGAVLDEAIDAFRVSQGAAT